MLLLHAIRENFLENFDGLRSAHVLLVGEAEEGNTADAAGLRDPCEGLLLERGVLLDDGVLNDLLGDARLEPARHELVGLVQVLALGEVLAEHDLHEPVLQRVVGLDGVVGNEHVRAERVEDARALVVAELEGREVELVGGVDLLGLLVEHGGHAAELVVGVTQHALRLRAELADVELHLVGARVGQAGVELEGHPLQLEVDAGLGGCELDGAFRGCAEGSQYIAPDLDNDGFSRHFFFFFLLFE